MSDANDNGPPTWQTQLMAMSYPYVFEDDITITYGHAGMSYEFMVKHLDGTEVISVPVEWDFGDGDSDTVIGDQPAAHTYAAPGHYEVTASSSGLSVSLSVTVS